MSTYLGKISFQKLFTALIPFTHNTRHISSISDNDKNDDLSLEEINGDSTKSSLPKKEETNRKRSTNKYSPRRRIPFPPKRPVRPCKK